MSSLKVIAGNLDKIGNAYGKCVYHDKLLVIVSLIKYLFIFNAFFDNCFQQTPITFNNSAFFGIYILFISLKSHLFRQVYGK